MPLVRRARRTEHDFETVKRTVADKCFFAGTGQHLKVFERLVLAFTTAAHLRTNAFCFAVSLALRLPPLCELPESPHPTLRELP